MENERRIFRIVKRMAKARQQIRTCWIWNYSRLMQWIVTDERQRSVGISVTVIGGVIRDGCDSWTFQGAGSPRSSL